MMDFYRLCVILLLCSGYSFGQLSYPIEQYYQREIERYHIYDSNTNSLYNSHLSSKPISESRTVPDSIYSCNDKYYYWITQKLFKENFLIFKGSDFWCAVDPVLDLEAGHDFGVDSLDLRYWNSRGIRVQAKFLNKVGFVTTFYENQAVVPDYQRSFFNAHGEFVVGGPDGYKHNNGVIPGYGRTKSFKQKGYDFAFASGYFTIEPNQHFNIRMGSGNQFIGNGYRSLLLSDNSFNYPFITAETNLWKGRIQYQVTYASLTNLYRLPLFTTTEASYERKIGTFHYLDIMLTRNISLGLFEGALWRRTDSTGTHIPDPFFVNPVIGLNSALKSNNTGFNSILGLNLCVQLKHNLVYAQAVIDHSKLSGYQAGIKLFDVLTPRFDLQAEYNHAEPNTYLSTDKRYNYSHYNLPLAHPLSAGFDELMIGINYQYKRWFIENHTVYSAHYQNDTLNLGADILYPLSTVVPEYYTRTKMFYNQTELGYRFNKRYNLQTAIGFVYRTDNRNINSSQTSYFYIAVRTKLKNKRFDY